MRSTTSTGLIWPSLAPAVEADLGIDAATMGLLLSGFFWTYAVMQMPFGYFADKVGARIALLAAVVWWSIFTALTAAARGVATFLGCRLLLGVGEAGAYPSCAKVASVWFPRSERGLASALFDSGSRIGSALAIPLVSWIISTLGWRESFVITGLLGFVWAAFWIWLYRDPEHHPSVAPEQLARLQPERGPAKSAEAPKAPWLSLFRYRAIWGMMIGFFCLNFVIFFITWFPTYLVQARGFSLKELGTLGILPALVAIPGRGIGVYVSDSLYRRGWSLTKARKTCLVGGMLMSSVITFSAFAPNAYVALVFAIAYASLAFTAAAIWSLPGDVAPTPGHVASIGGSRTLHPTSRGSSRPHICLSSVTSNRCPRGTKEAWLRALLRPSSPASIKPGEENERVPRHFPQLPRRCRDRARNTGAGHTDC